MNNTGNQNLLLGVVAGIVAAVIGAVLWALITVATEYQIGWMAVGVGFLVGYAVRYFGKGTDSIFGISGAAIALLGCMAGNILTMVILVAKQEHMEIIQVLSRLSPGIIIELLKDGFQAMDLLFYGIAVYEAYKYSFTPVEQESAAVSPAE